MSDLGEREAAPHTLRHGGEVVGVREELDEEVDGVRVVGAGQGLGERTEQLLRKVVAAHHPQPPVATKLPVSKTVRAKKRAGRREGGAREHCKVKELWHRAETKAEHIR